MIPLMPAPQSAPDWATDLYVAFESGASGAPTVDDLKRGCVGTPDPLLSAHPQRPVAYAPAPQA